jgi:DNA modification methylase
MLEARRIGAYPLGQSGTGSLKRTPGLKSKDLIGIPWRVAFALQADGWYLRQDIIWSKPNPMPESVTDRCTKAHEYVFLLSKGPRYYFDHEAIKEPVAASTVSRLQQNVEDQAGSDRVPGKTNGPMKAVRSKANSFRREGSKRELAIPGQSVGTHRPDRKESDYSLDTRNKRSVWSVATRPFKGAHFATFPEKLIEPCILAGCPAGGTVLDPFGGACTTALVAERLDRRSIMIEMNPEYAALGFDRLFQQAKTGEAA